MGKVLMDQITKKVIRTRKFRREALISVEKEARKARKDLLSFFDSHYFTRKIEDGPDPDQTKNLYGFIGFDGGNPIMPLRMLLENSFRVNKRPISSTSRSWSYRVRMPSEEQLKNATPMPWLVGQSWLEAVEVGIPGLAQYLNKKAGRSGAGIQVSNSILGRKAEFEPKPYLLTKLREIRRRLSGGNAIR